jgi:hypothetical protein
MKYLKILSILFSFIFLSSCEKDESLDRRPLIVEGNFVRLDITNKFLNLDKPNDFYFGGILTAPNGKIKSYELFVRMTTGLDVQTSGYVKIPVVVNSFPFDLRITPQILADALNIQVNSFTNKTTFEFLGYAYDLEGKKYDYNNLSSVVKSLSSSKQAFKFKTAIFNNANFIANSVPDVYLAFSNY